MAKRAMKKTYSKVYKEKLLLLRARLRGDVNTMADAALKDASDARLSIHMADAGTDNFEIGLTGTIWIMPHVFALTPFPG